VVREKKMQEEYGEPVMMQKKSIPCCGLDKLLMTKEKRLPGHQRHTAILANGYRFIRWRVVLIIATMKNYNGLASQE